MKNTIYCLIQGKKLSIMPRSLIRFHGRPMIELMVHLHRVRPWLSPPTIPQVIVFVMVVTTLALASCRQASIEDDSSNAIPIPPTSLKETISVTPTLPPQATVTLPPGPAPTIEPALTACPHEYFFLPRPPSCPAGEPLASAAAEQPFEGGVMVWFEATDSIYVFYKSGRWQRFDDTWSEDQDQSDPAFSPPTERFQPIRGFGKVWREHPNVRELLGWALGVELAFNSMMQQQAVGIDDARVIFLATFNGQVFALTGHGQDEGDWVIAAS